MDNDDDVIAEVNIETLSEDARKLIARGLESLSPANDFERTIGIPCLVALMRNNKYAIAIIPSEQMRGSNAGPGTKNN